jgi:cysteine desulfuration protein SufE
MMIRVLSNQKPDDIVKAKLDFIDKIGLKEHLAPTRSNGLSAMIKQMRMYALAYSLKQQEQKIISN